SKGAHKHGALIQGGELNLPVRELSASSDVEERAGLSQVPLLIVIVRAREKLSGRRTREYEALPIRSRAVSRPVLHQVRGIVLPEGQASVFGLPSSGEKFLTLVVRVVCPDSLCTCRAGYRKEQTKVDQPHHTGGFLFQDT